ncbi:MAG: CHAT domain-containing protein [Acidimicrobiales bacterium]
MRSLDFELKIGIPAGRTVPVSVLGSPAGEGRVEMTFPYDSLALENRLQSLQLALLAAGPTRRRLVPEHERAVQTFGSEMFDALFTGDIRSLFDRSRQEAIRQGADLRIQLRFESADMASLPWEFLFDSRRAEYLCLSTTTPVVRYVELADPQEPLTVAPPLRLLAMAASPSDLPALDVAQEKARMEAALGDLSDRFELHWVPGQTWRDLQAALRQGPWHAFHFVGHGGFDANLGEGIIALTADGGGTHRLCATDLGRLLGDHHPLRLAVLNACDGARADRMDVFSSTAAVLVRRGTPAVVAMQYEITDTAAVELSRAFYGALAAGLPVDESLGEARKSVALAVPGTLEWGTPVLYLRAPDSRIFDIDRQAAPPTPPRAPRPEPEPEPVRVVAAHADATPALQDEPAPGGPTPPEPVAGGTRTRSRRPLILAAAGAAALVLVIVLAVVLNGDGEPTGTGTFDLAVDGGGGYVTHPVKVPRNTILLVEVNPSDEFDPDLAASTDAATGRALAIYLKEAGFDRDRFRDLFDDYGYTPSGTVLVGRIDEEGVGQRERLLVTAPRGGTFDIVVAGAADTSGDFELDVTAVDFPADRDGGVYVDDLVDAGVVRDFLSDDARSDLAEWGSIEWGFGAGEDEELDGSEGEDPLELHVSVPAAVPWTDAGVDVLPGYQLTFAATGEIFDDLPANPNQSFEPDGLEDRAGMHTGDPYLQFNHAALLAKIGEDGEPFLIGSEADVPAETEGRLFLGINDGFFGDNGGSYEVRIEVT